jgi:drug/metabolite transporter (DMT)-like permease
MAVMSPTSAHFALLLAAAFWGFGNIAQKTVLDYLGPLGATCLRCAIAALVLLPFAMMERQKTDDEDWWRSIFLVSVTFAAAISLQQMAYQSTSVTNASFLVNTATVLTPLAAWLFLSQKTGRTGLAAAAITLLGACLMSDAASGFTALTPGDVLCLLSAIFYALWMVALGHHAQRHGRPFLSAFVQFAFAAVASLPPAIVIEGIDFEAVAAATPELAVLGLLSTAAAFSLQTVAQRYTTASRAAVLVSGESIFGAVGAYAVLGERPQWHVLTGALLIFTAIMIVAFSAHVHAPSLEPEREG